MPPYPRLAEPRLVDALEDSPAVLVHGPRQCGKTTLVRQVGDRLGYRYLTFDDDVLAAAATADPAGFIADLPGRSIIDEVQRVPGLFTSLKASIDRDRSPGRFLLTGSANVLLVPRLSDSLAGRMQTMRLHPLAQSELEGIPPTFLDRLFNGRLSGGTARRLGAELAERIVAGGYPAALLRPIESRRSAWYRDYIDALVQRDVRDLARISTLDALPRLLAGAATQTAQLFNLAELAAPFQLSRPTIGDYVTLLERVFLLERVPSWHNNRLKRLVKASKLHLTDTGLACSLLGVGAADVTADRPLLGPLLETFVIQELKRQASGHTDDFRFFHFRDKDGGEVDIVIERGARAVAGVEIKAAATVRASDFNGLIKLRAAADKRFVAGVVVYDGEAAVGFGDRLYAVPVRHLWEAAP